MRRASIVAVVIDECDFLISKRPSLRSSKEPVRASSSSTRRRLARGGKGLMFLAARVRGARGHRRTRFASDAGETGKETTARVSRETGTARRVVRRDRRDSPRERDEVFPILETDATTTRLTDDDFAEP